MSAATPLRPPRRAAATSFKLAALQKGCEPLHARRLVALVRFEKMHRLVDVGAPSRVVQVQAHERTPSAHPGSSRAFNAATAR